MAVPLVVVGAGGFGREVLDVIEAINSTSFDPAFDIIGIADDAPQIKSLKLLSDRGFEYLGTVEHVRRNFRESQFLIGVGNPRAREVIDDLLCAVGMRPATAIHPCSVIGTQAVISDGAVVCAGVNISTNVHLGRHVHVNPGAIIGHDSRISSFVSINPGAVLSGDVTVGEGALVGACAVVLQGIDVGRKATIGAGAVVVHNVPGDSIVKGVPAR